MNGPSTHLSWKELACKDGTPYPEEFILDGRVFKLAAVFESVRNLCQDKPIIILSAYRTLEWNRKIGGAKNSQHVQGRALDLKHTKLFNAEFYKIIKENIDYLGITGLGLYKTFVHVDIRPTNRIVYWYSSLPKESKK